MGVPAHQAAGNDKKVQAWAQSTCPELPAQGLVPLCWGCALPRLREPCEWGGPRGEAGLEPVFPIPHLWGSSWSWSPSPSSHPACGSPLCDALRVAGGRDTHTPTQPGVHGCRPHTAERPSRPGSVTTGHPLPGGHRPSSAWGLGLGPPPPACRRRRWTVCVALCGRHLEQRGGRADPVTQRRSRTTCIHPIFTCMQY